jgi:tetratricopeptide (TPR) repeat protein
MPTENPREPWTLPEPARPAEPETAPHEPAETPGTIPEATVPMVLRDPTWPTVPGYEITGEIARGGMGVVYAARDLTLNRPVAVKTVLPQFIGRADLVAQFVREAGLTALLQHPGVPPVHFAGTLSDGRPFLAMKLIGGRTLADELAATDRVANLPRLLGVFEAISQTVGYAHSQGIIHRDLKPGNVMVGAFGEVQVMDWGLAKPLADPETGHGTGEGEADAEATRPGSAKGTPAYMPPEQARGEWDRVDARSDVFALGGTLAVLLTGKAPYTGRSGVEVLRRAAAADLGEAFARLDRSPADPELVGLCKRCLSPDPADRPADGKAVAEAVAAYRARLDVRARKAEAERAAAEAEAREQRKRRKVQLGLAAALVTIVGLVAAGAWYRNSQAQQREFARRQQEERDRAAREENGRRVGEYVAACEKALDADDDAVGAERGLREIQTRVPAGGTEHLADRIARCHNDLATLRKLDEFDDFRTTPRNGRMPDAEAQKARVSAVFREFGIIPGQTPAREAARRIAASHVRERLLAALEWWHGVTLMPELRAMLQEADPNPYREAVRDAFHPHRRSGQIALLEKPEALEQPPRFALVWGFQAREVAPDRGRAILAETRRRYPRNFQVVMLLGGLYKIGQNTGADDREVWYQVAVSLRPTNTAAWDGLGIALGDKGRLAEAAAAFRVVLKFTPGDALTRNNLGNVLFDLKDMSGALAEYQEAIRLEPGLATAHNGLGNILKTRREFIAAITEYREAIRLEPDYAEAHSNLGDTLFATGDHKGAVGAIQEAIRLKPEHAGFYRTLGLGLRSVRDLKGAIAAFAESTRLSPQDAVTHSVLGVTLYEAGEMDAAVAALRTAIRIDPKLAIAHSNLGTVLLEKPDVPGALAALAEAVRLDPKSAEIHYNLGRARRAGDDLRGAVAAYREAIRLNPEHAKAYNNMGTALHASGELDKALEAFRAAIQLDPKAHDNLGAVLHEKNDLEGAIVAYRQALRIDPNYIPAHYNLGNALKDSGNLSDAIVAYQDTIRLDPRHAEAHCNLGLVLQRQRRFQDALPLLRRGHELGSKKQGWAYPSAKWVADCERLLPRLPIQVAPAPREVKR